MSICLEKYVRHEIDGNREYDERECVCLISL